MNKHLCNIITLLFTLSLLSCSSLPIENKKIISNKQRIQFLVIHHSAQKLKPGTSTNTDTNQNIAHYLVDQPTEGGAKIVQFLDETAVAQLTDNSHWQAHSNIDDISIGIEVVNKPECTIAQQTGQEICLFTDYTPQQIELLIKLSKDILARNPAITPTHIIGHSDIALNSATFNSITLNDNSEPGPRFPWYQLYQAGIGAWYDTDTVDTYWQIFQGQKPNIGLAQQALAQYGYHVAETGEVDSQTRAILRAFQAHFLPWQVTGDYDTKTAAVLFALIDKYFPQKITSLVTRYHAEKFTHIAEPMVRLRGQVDRRFPDDERSTRELVNDRTLFKAYKGRGDIIIDSIDAVSADIFINGQKINIAKQLEPGKKYQYSLSKRTKNGINTLRVENVLPENSYINITIPYPTLNTAKTVKAFDFSKVDKLINNDVKQGFPGAVLVVVKDGQIVKHKAYGSARKFADGGKLLPRPIAMQRDTVFDIASNTKMFATNFAIMKLVSEGKLDVNKPMSFYLTDYKGADRETRLVKDFLTHQAGYSPQVRFFTKDNKLGEQFFSQNKRHTEQLILDQVPFSYGRNVNRKYSDTDYMLLGMLIERITSKSLDDYVEKDIYTALNLKDTKFNPLLKGHVKNDFAATEIHGNTRGGRVKFDNVREYVLQGEVHDEKAFHSFEGVAGHAGLFSTTNDIAILMQALLNDGGYGKTQLFDAKTLNQFVKPDFGDGTFGLGWRRAYHGDLKWHFGPYASPSAYGHTGWTGTVTVIDPEHDLAIALFTNARHTLIEETDEGAKFKGKLFETGNYGSVISLIYEAVLEQTK